MENNAKVFTQEHVEKLLELAFTKGQITAVKKMLEERPVFPDYSKKKQQPCHCGQRPKINW